MNKIKEFKKELQVYKNLCKKGEEKYIKCQEDRVVETLKESIIQQKEESLLEGEKSMAKGVLRRIAKGRSLEQILVLCGAVIIEKL